MPSGGFAWAGSDKVSVIEYILDLSRRQGVNVPAAGYVTGDILLLGDVPKGAQILGGVTELLVAEGAAATVALATTGTAIALLTAASVNGTPNVIVPMTVTTGLILVDSVLAATLGGTLAAGGGKAKLAIRLLVANMG
jgi:hypothetical protein